MKGTLFSHCGYPGALHGQQQATAPSSQTTKQKNQKDQKTEVEKCNCLKSGRVSPQWSEKLQSATQEKKDA